MFPKYEHRNCPIHVGERKHQGSYPARFHKHLEVMLVKSSRIRVTIDAVSYTLEPGDLYVAFPNVLHAIEAKDTEAVVLLADYENAPYFQDVLRNSRPEPPVLRAGEFDRIVYSLLERMVELAAGEASSRQQILKGYADTVLCELLTSLHLVPRSTDSDLVQQLIFYISRNYTRPISLESIAQALGYSKYYISREIRTLFGCNLRTLINSYRLSMAQNLLGSGNAPVSQIAAACGFKNQSAFNRIFLEQIGCTPSQYRHRSEEVPELPAVDWKD